MNAFDEIMQYCPFLKNVIEEKIEDEISKAKQEKEKQLKELKGTMDSLILNSLGDDENV